MNKTFFIIGGIALFASFGLGRCFFAAPAPVNGEPLPVVINVAPAHAASTPTVQPTATMQPISGAPVRVNFASGSYGETLAGDTGTAYLLWAAAGQTFTTTLSADSTALASLYAPDGVALYQDLAAGYTAAATLPTSGDYRLEIRTSGSYTVGVMIR